MTILQYKFLLLNLCHTLTSEAYHFLTACAIEGQVKEKSRWFSSLRDLTRKLKVVLLQVLLFNILIPMDGFSSTFEIHFFNRF